ncbi:MAG: helix-turn-helix transcriptional regulator [Clostridiales bacterium]|nr:helix-turn-helix transcriptional regulator [Clostridiales bacterium]
MSDLQTYLDQALKTVEINKNEEPPCFDDYDIEEEVCQLIISTRNALGITQNHLAEKSGVSQANISRIEKGNYHPSIAVLKRIADGLGKRLIIEFAERDEI